MITVYIIKQVNTYGNVLLFNGFAYKGFRMEPVWSSPTHDEPAQAIMFTLFALASTEAMKLGAHTQVVSVDIP